MHMQPQPQQVVEEVEINWVQCNACEKWRALPSNVDPNSLPDEWFCKFNVWSPELATCDAPEEVPQQPQQQQQQAPDIESQEEEDGNSDNDSNYSDDSGDSYSNNHDNNNHNKGHNKGKGITAERRRASNKRQKSEEGYPEQLRVRGPVDQSNKIDLPDQLELDPWGFVITKRRRKKKCENSTPEENVPM